MSKQNKPSKQTVFIEMFPVRVESLPKLHAYQLSDPTAGAGRVASRLARQHEGRWAAADDLVLTDDPPKKADFDPAAEGLDKVKRFRPTAVMQAEFLIQALVPPLADAFSQALQTPLQSNFRVLQEPSFRAWSVDGSPAISIGIVQRLIHKLDLAEHAALIPDTRGLVGMTVISRLPWVDGRLLSGIVVANSGTLGDHRATLERFARTPDAKKRLERAPDSEPVVKVRTFFGDYDFAASSLFIALSAKDYARLRVDAAEAKKASYQDIADRARSVAAASNVLKAMDYIGDGYNADRQPDMFASASDLNFGAQIMLGDHAPRPYVPRNLWTQMGQAGMFHTLPQQRPVRLGIVNALGDVPPGQYDERLLKTLKDIGVDIGAVQSVITSGLTPGEAHDAFKQLDAPDAVIAFIPGSEPSAYSNDADWAAFENIKREVIASGLPSVSVFEDNMGGKNSAQEHALMFALAVGHTPFALGVPLPFADAVMGLHVIRGETDTFVTQVYDSAGAFVGYIIQHGKLDAARLFPSGFFTNVRLVFQHVDRITDEERDTLREQANALNMTLHFTDIGAGANPRLYALIEKGVRQPSTGTAFMMDDTQALMIPALPSHPAAPPNPLHIQTDAKFPVELGMRAILAMNTLHPTARKPRLPVTLHYGERIRRLVKAGVMPPAAEGDLVWWL